MRIFGIAGLIGFCAFAAIALPVLAQNYPAQPIRVVVGFQAADGYTLLMSNSTIAIPSLFANLPFDVSKDFDPISLVAIGPSVLAVHPSVPVNTVKELIALANVPTIDEAGLPGYDAATWYGFFAPAGTPKNVLATLGKEVVKIMSVPDIKGIYGVLAALEALDEAGVKTRSPIEVVAWTNEEGGRFQPCTMGSMKPA